METTRTARVAFLNPPVLIGFALYAAGFVLAFGATRAVGGDNAVAELSASGPAQATGGTWTVTGDLHAPRAKDHTGDAVAEWEGAGAGGGSGGGGRGKRQLCRSSDGNGSTSGTWIIDAAGTPRHWQWAAWSRRCSLRRSFAPQVRVAAQNYTIRLPERGRTPAGFPSHSGIIGDILRMDRCCGGRRIAGDPQNPGENQTGAELYDPATGIWTATGSMSVAHSHHTATLLPSGQVLVAGGYSGSNALSAELYDPATGVWAATRNLPIGRWDHTATLLPNGQVLVAGGIGNNFSSIASAELYDPATRELDGNRQYGP